MKLVIDPNDIAPIVEAAIVKVLEQFGAGDRLAYHEAEAAGLLGVKQHVLRDARLRGEITGSKLGRGYSYTRGELLEFLEHRREADL